MWFEITERQKTPNESDEGILLHIKKRKIDYRKTEVMTFIINKSLSQFCGYIVVLFLQPRMIMNFIHIHNEFIFKLRL